ncbi:MAG: DNA repair protein RadD [Candidatus Pseudothioglobus sp.]|jgi:DNA repair protein RadD
MIKLRHYQAGCTPALTEYINSNPGKHPLVGMPTGSGKTYCIADLVQHYSPKYDIIILSHVKEILEQNHESLSEYLDEEVGLNSAGLGKREWKHITVAGIQSVYKQSSRVKENSIIIIDEAHLISPNAETMYQTFFQGLRSATIIGFTATPFRLGHGLIYGNGRMFDDLVYDWTSAERFQQLVDEGYLAQITSKRTKLEMDVSEIKLKAGEFNEVQLSAAFDRDGVTKEAIKEIISAGHNRKKWLIFAIDINHAEHIAETLLRNGVRCAPVHSRMEESGFERDKIIEAFKNGKYRCVVNVNILTTGFDEPGIDLIAMLRPTNSPVLHVQSLGRGSRVSPNKANCLVLDFAGNTERLGPINNVIVKQKGKGKGGGEQLTKTCPNCSSILSPAVKFCPDCNHEFQFQHGLSSQAANIELVQTGKALWLNLDSINYSIHKKFGSPSSIKVTYNAEGVTISEFVCIEYKGYAKHKANHWVKFRGGELCETAKELLDQSKLLKIPTRIQIQKKGNYNTIKNAEFDV